MEIIKSTKGRTCGEVSVPLSMATMAVGEEWRFTGTAQVILNARVNAIRVCRSNGRRYTTAVEDNTLVIRRLA